MNKKGSWARRVAALVGGGGLAVALIGLQTGWASAAGAQSSDSANAQSSNAGGPDNPYSPAYGHTYRHGVVPTQEQQAKMDAWAATHSGGGSTSTGPETLSYGGGVGGVGVTSGTPQIYLVFWGSQWTDGTGDPNGAASYIQSLFKGLGTAPSGSTEELWSGTMTQYCDGVSAGSTTCPSGSAHVGYPGANGALAGVWFDNSAAAPSSASANDIAQEAVNAAQHFASSTYRDAQFDVLSPSGTNPDNWLNGGYCAWHDYTGDGYSTTNTLGNLAFTNMPYVSDVGYSCGEGFVNGSAGTLDGFSIVNGHEYAETLTDQFPAGGWTNHQRGNFRGEEVGDECAWITSGTGALADVAMSTGSFAMQSIWSNDTNNCAMSHPIVTGSTGGGGGGGPDTVTVKSPGSQSWNLNLQISPLTITPTDSASGQTFTFTVSGLPRGLKATVSSTKTSVTISGTPSRRGSSTATVTATDTTGARGSASFAWTVG